MQNPVFFSNLGKTQGVKQSASFGKKQKYFKMKDLFSFEKRNKQIALKNTYRF